MSDRTFERAVRDWLDDGSDRTPQPAIDAVLLAVKTTPQERGLRIPRRFAMPASLRYLAAAAILAVAAAAAVVLSSGSPAPEGVRPSPGASPTSTAVATESCPPLERGNKVLMGCYSTSAFAVPFTLTGRQHWALDAESTSKIAFTVGLPNSPTNVTDLTASLIVFDRTYVRPCHAQSTDPGGSVPYTGRTPTDFWTWFADTLPMVTFETPTPGRLGGFAGLQALSTTQVNQLIDACAGAWWVDFADVGTGDPEYIAENPGAERITAIVVDGKTLLLHIGIGSSGPSNETDSAYFPTFAAEVDQLFATLRFTAATP